MDGSLQWGCTIAEAVDGALTMPGIAAATADATGVAFGGSGTELLAAATTGVHGVDTSANELGVNLSTE